MELARNAVDQLIGRNVMTARIGLEISRSDLARSIGVSETQMSKYECGISRITAVRLSQIAAALGMRVADFFIEIAAAENAKCEAATPDSIARHSQVTAEAVALVRAFQRIVDPEERKSLIELAERLAETSDRATESM